MTQAYVEKCLKSMDNKCDDYLRDLMLVLTLVAVVLVVVVVAWFVLLR